MRRWLTVLVLGLAVAACTAGAYQPQSSDNPRDTGHIDTGGAGGSM